MEEVIVERTIKTLTDHLSGEMTKVWDRNEELLKKLDSSHEKNLTLPFSVVSDDFYRFSLDERVSPKGYRFIISCQRNIADSTDRADLANEYDLEILFLYDFNFSGKSRYYIPMRVRQAIIQTIQENSREISGRSSYVTLSDIQTAEAAGKGARTVLCGLLYKVIA